MRLILTRPRADSEALAARLAAHGVDGLVAPVLSVRRKDAPAPDLDGAQALLFTSANGVRAFAESSDLRDLPVFAVGDTTAAAARDAGFADVVSADGDAAALAAAVRARLQPDKGALVHAAGSHTAGGLDQALAEAGFEYRRAVLYEAETVETLPDTAARALAEGAADGVVLFSPRSARAFVSLAAAAGHEAALGRLTAWCLSQAVADSLQPSSWARVAVSPAPREDALIDMIAKDRDAAAGSAATAAPPAAEEKAAEAAPQPAPPGPAEAPRARRDAVWIGALAGAAAAAVVTILLSLALSGGGGRGADQALAQRVAALESGQAARADRVQTLGDRVGRLESAPNPAKGVGDTVASLVQRVEALEKAQARAATGASAADLAAARGESQAGDSALADQIAALRADLTALRRRVDAGSGEAKAAGALLIAAGQLRAAMAEGRPYGGELASVRALAASGAVPQTALDALDALDAHADTGIVPLATLRDRYGRAAAAVLRAAARPEDGNWLGEAAAAVSGLVTVRRTGEVEGDSPEAVLARAGVKLDAGDVAAAADMVAGLGAPAEVARAWLDDARAHAQAMAALGALTDAVAQRAARE